MALPGLMAAPRPHPALLRNLALPRPLGLPPPPNHPAQRLSPAPALAAASLWRLGASVVAWVASAHQQTSAGMVPGQGIAVLALASSASSAMLSKYPWGE
jgi:hypothetical protein